MSRVPHRLARKRVVTAVATEAAIGVATGTEIAVAVAVVAAGVVVVLGAADHEHPGGHLKTIVTMPIAHPHDIDVVSDPRFIAARRHLHELVHPQAHATGERLPIIRMVPVGDEA